MNTVKNSGNFLVLVPHKDTRGILQKIKGFPGTFPFPCVAPLAYLSEPLNSEELKHIARSLREAKGMDKFELTDFACTTFPTDNDEMNLCGPCININFPEITNNSVAQKINNLLSPAVIGTCLIPKDIEGSGSCGLCGSWLNSSSDLSFRAAAIANMYWQPCIKNDEKVFKWKIDKLFWLPKNIKKDKQLAAE